jgi:hypothetical protein
VCPECGGFVPLQDDRLTAHDAYRGTNDPAETAGRAAWFNTFGWG